MRTCRDGMSTLPDNELDLEKLFLPAWAQESPSTSSKYAHYEGETERFDRSRGRGPERRGPRPPRRDAPGGQRGGENRPRSGGDRPPGAGRPGDRREGRRDQRGDGRRPEQRERREPPAPLPELNVSLVPDRKGVESLARQIKMTGRAYPLFDIAQMILQKPERHEVVFAVKKNAEGKPIQPLYVCALDDSLWLSEDEAVGHVLRKHFETFYQAEKTATEPPKGTYTFVAQCGMSGVILGPPNHHDYQNQLRKLHAQRFSRMPFDAFKSRVKIVRDEEVVKKWVEDQSWKTEYVCLNLPEPLRLGSMAEVEKHFREVHKDNIIKPVEAHTLQGTAARNLRSPELARFYRTIWDDQRRFPLQIATVLSQQFAGFGLQFFKVNKTITHVSVARPHYLDLTATPVSEGVKKIVDYINTHTKCNRRTLIEALAPSSSAPAAPAQPVTPAAPAPEGQVAEAAPAPAADQPTAEQTALIADLHWLIHQGHVIEFATGILETAKKPLPKPPKPAKTPEKPAETAAAEPSGQPAAQSEQAGQAEAPATPSEPNVSAPVSETPAPSNEFADSGSSEAAMENTPGTAESPKPEPPQTT